MTMNNGRLVLIIDCPQPINMMMVMKIHHPILREWFIDWIKGFQETAEKDDVYILGIFRKEDGANLGNIEVIKILRQDYDWGMMGYSIHNQFFRQGYGKESVQAATELFFTELNFHRH